MRSKGVSRKRKEEKIQEKFDEGDYTLMEYLGTDGLDFKLSNTWTLYSDSFHSQTLIMLLLFCAVLIIFIW